MNKKLVKVAILVLTMMVMLSTSVFASEQVIHIYDSGERIEFTESMGQPFITSESRTMIPLRAVSESLGFEISWDNEAYAAKIISLDIEIVLPINKNFGYVDGDKVQFDTTTIIKDGRTYVPLRFVSENLGYKVDWRFGRDEKSNDEIANIIDITKKIESLDNEMNVNADDFNLRNEVFKEIISQYGEIQEVEGTGGNFSIGTSGFSYNHKSVDRGFNSFGMTIPNSDRNDLENEIKFSFGRYSEIEKNIFKDSLKYLLGEKYHEDIDDVASILNKDIESTRDGNFFETKTLSGKSHEIGDLKIRYFEKTSYFYVYVGY